MSNVSAGLCLANDQRRFAARISVARERAQIGQTYTEISAINTVIDRNTNLTYLENRGFAITAGIERVLQNRKLRPRVQEHRLATHERNLKVFTYQSLVTRTLLPSFKWACTRCWITKAFP